MADGVLAFLIVVVSVAILVPLALCYLLVRQVLRSPLVVRVRTRLAPAAHVRGGTAPRGVPSVALGRQWALLYADALQARDRYDATVGGLRKGPLRDTLAAAEREVDIAVGEAQRLAMLGTRTERAQREILAALDSQRRRRRRGLAAPNEVVVSLDAAARAQHESAERLAESTRLTLSQLQLVVARLYELSAHTLELSALADSPPLSATTSVADSIAALRAASEEVQMVAGL